MFSELYGSSKKLDNWTWWQRLIILPTEARGLQVQGQPRLQGTLNS